MDLVTLLYHLVILKLYDLYRHFQYFPERECNHRCKQSNGVVVQNCILLILQLILRMEYARGNDFEFNKRLTAQFIVNNPQDWSALKLNRLAGECSIEDGKLHCQILKIVVQQQKIQYISILAPGSWIRIETDIYLLISENNIANSKQLKME